MTKSLTKFKTKYLIALIILVIAAFLCPIPFLANFTHGTKVIEISSAEGLFQMATDFNQLTQDECVYRLTADIDFEGQKWPGTGETAFCGRFDGNGHTIKNFEIVSNSSYAGFWTKTENAFIYDVNFENVWAEIDASEFAKGQMTFGIIAKAKGGVFQNITLSNSAFKLKGNEIIAGGLIGEDCGENGERTNILLTDNNFEIENNLKAGIFGGIAGKVNSTSLAYKICKAKDNVKFLQNEKAQGIVGGLLGKIEGEQIKLRELSCLSTLEIHSTSSVVGGLIGQINPRTVLNITPLFSFDGTIIQRSR